MAQQLEHLARAYFHQDFDLDAGPAEAVLESFVAGEGLAACAELASEIETLLASNATERQLRELWIDTWGASYDPLDDGMGMRNWLASVHSRLSDGVA